MTFDSTQEFLQSLPEVQPGESFWFACHPGVPCFNACCSDLTMPLTPYDVLRLRRGLKDMGSEQFFEEFANVGCYEDSGFPLLHLRMDDSPMRLCPFLTESGCGVYPHRSTACRTYPLGRATRPADEVCAAGPAGGGQGGGCSGGGKSAPAVPGDSGTTAAPAGFGGCGPTGGGGRGCSGKEAPTSPAALSERYFLVREDHCKGFAQHKEWTIATWLSDQGLTGYNRMNDRYMRLMARYKSVAKGAILSGRHATLALLCLYQQDRFLEFLNAMNVFSRLAFAGEYAAAPREEHIARILGDEEARLWFAFDWMELALFGSSANLAPAAG